MAVRTFLSETTIVFESKRKEYMYRTVLYCTVWWQFFFCRFKCTVHHHEGSIKPFTGIEARHRHSFVIREYF